MRRERFREGRLMRVTGVEREMSEQGGEQVVLCLEMSQRYRHPVGWANPFYLGLDRGVLRATRCSDCGESWFPPRRFCPSNLAETIWYDLRGTGTVVAATRVHTPPPFGGIDPPYVLASIRLDGVNGGITHQVMGADPPEYGREVAVAFGSDSPTHPLLTFSFTVKGADR